MNATNSGAPRIVQILRKGPSGSLLIFETFHVNVDATGQIRTPLGRLVITPKHAHSMKNTATWQNNHISRAAWRRLDAMDPREMARIIQRTLNHHIIDHRIAAATRRISPWYTGVETYNLLATADHDTIERILKDDLHAAAITLARKTRTNRNILVNPWPILEQNGFTRRHIEQLVSLPHSMRQTMLDQNGYDITREILESLDHHPWIRNISRKYAWTFLFNMERFHDASAAARYIERHQLLDVLTDWTDLTTTQKGRQKKREAIMKAILETPHEPLSREFSDLKDRLKVIWQLTNHTTAEELIEAAVHPESTARRFGMTLREWKKIALAMTELCDLYIYRKCRLIIPRGPELGRALLQLVRTHGARRVRKAIKAHCPSDSVTSDEDILHFIRMWCAARPDNTSSTTISRKISLIARIRDITDMNQALALIRHPHPRASSQALKGPECALDARRPWPLPHARPGRKFLIGELQNFQNRVHTHEAHKTLLRLKAFSSRLKRIAALEDRGLTTRSITHDGRSCILHDGERIHAILRRPENSPCLTISLQRHRTHLAITGGRLDTPLAKIASAIDWITPEHALPPEKAREAMNITAILTALMWRQTTSTDLTAHPYVQTLHEAGVVLAVGKEDLFVGDFCALTACEEHINYAAAKLAKLSTTMLLQAMQKHIRMDGSESRTVISADSEHPDETGDMEYAFD